MNFINLTIKLLKLLYNIKSMLFMIVFIFFIQDIATKIISNDDRNKISYNNNYYYVIDFSIYFLCYTITVYFITYRIKNSLNSITDINFFN
jgi:mannose/fructose/N-acetylgalactosamine-specific phosphotransferase system component IIC